MQEQEVSVKETTNVSLQDAYKEAKELRRNSNKSKSSNKQETFTPCYTGRNPEVKNHGTMNTKRQRDSSKQNIKQFLTTSAHYQEVNPTNVRKESQCLRS